MPRKVEAQASQASKAFAKTKGGKSTTAATSGFETKLWAAADASGKNMDAAECNHVVLGLIFVKYISDAFEAKHAELDAQRKQGAHPDEYCAANPRHGQSAVQSICAAENAA